MSLFNEKLKVIPLKEVLSIFILLFLVQYFLNTLNIVQLDSIWIYILLILYIIFKLDFTFPDKDDYLEVLSADVLKQVVLLVILNVFISYGFLYLSHALLNLVPALNFLFGSSTASNSIMALSLVATIVVSPVAEELIFRGIFLNRLQVIIPPLFAILVSSLLFASLHSYGSIISAFIFAICMAILYLKTENILIPIFAHFLNNLLAEIIVRADVNSLLFTNDVVIGAMSILAVISFVLLFKSIIPELNSIK